MACEEVKFTDYQYRLRAGAPMPVSSRGQFVMHTFMAEKSRIDVYAYTTNIVGSSSFRGQGGDYMSASYSRILDESGDVFQGKVVHEPTYISEMDL